MEKNKISISVRELIEFIMRYGDIKPTQISVRRAVDGTKAHKKVQKAMGSNYTAEYPVQDVIEYINFNLIISGRADGLIQEEEGLIIDEIKSTTRDLDDITEDLYSLHWAQGKMYAYIIAKSEYQDNISVQLTYININNYETKRFIKEFTIQELQAFYYDLVDKYYKWAERLYLWNIKKKESINMLTFPFENFRKGQKRLLSSVYKTLMEGNKLFLRAPTGTGKTIGTIYPAIKAVAEKQEINQIFYLTAKTIGREVAENTFNMLQARGLEFKTITLTAKEKACFMEKAECDPAKCEYAKGHYDRINDALWDILVNENNFDRSTIAKYAEKHKVCPFEYALDISLFSDAIICDYNYAFDPKAMLKRFFADERGNYIFLIDEAHNLVDRAREMYSASLNKKKILSIKKAVKGLDNRLNRYLGQANKLLLETMQHCKSNNIANFSQKEIPDELIQASRGIVVRIEHLLSSGIKIDSRDELIDFYFEVYDFLKKSELYDERYITYYTFDGKDITVRMYCLDPSYLLREGMKKAYSTIIFSATLIPLDYYVDILGGDKDNYGIELESPFEQDKLCLIINDGISTKYKDRSITYNTIAKTTLEAINSRKGNYLIYFPSYSYMEEVYNIIKNMLEDNEVELLLQTSDMTEVEKENFLNKFNHNNENSLLGFAVLGGVFGEGIDLVGERLSGVIIVGVGLPGICYERDIIRDYYPGNLGYKYSYMYPGMNKVMQAVGRVIRTEDDTGMVLLIDDRYNQYSYKQVFPKEWSHRKYITESEMIKEELINHWENA